MGLSIFPDARINYRDIIFASVPEGIGWNAVNSDGWRAGPLAKVRFGRDEKRGGSPFLISGGSDALRDLGDIDTSVEVGGFIERRFGADGEWRLRGEVRRGFGGHEGIVGDASLAYQIRIASAIVSAGPRVSVASSEFMQTYFGIDALQSLRSGLATYRAKGGVLSYGIGATVIQPLSAQSAVTLLSGLDCLGDPAADSPLVRERGQRTQFTIGLGYGYRFNL